MPRAPWKPCPTPGCGELTPGGRCPTCAQAADKARGTPTERGYTGPHRSRFRRGVLAAHPICTCPGPHHAHPDVPCRHPSTVADHHPLSRRQLVTRGLDPDDPAHGRGLCASCHGWSTQSAADQRGGWNAR